MKTIIALVLGLIAACASTQVNSIQPDQDVEGYDAWSRALLGSAKRGDGTSSDIERGLWGALPLERIRLVRTNPMHLTRFEIVFERGGAAVRSGGMHDWPSPDVASHMARIPLHAYIELCWLQGELELPRASQRWARIAFHAEITEIECTTTAGETVHFEDYGGACPPEISAFAAAIELAARRLEWTPVETAARTEDR